MTDKKLIDCFIHSDINSLTKKLPDCVDQHPECCNGPLCTMPGGNLCAKCPKCPCHLCRLPVCKKTRKTPGNISIVITSSFYIIVVFLFLLYGYSITFHFLLDVKQEGEECGFPPNGTICFPDDNYGICGKGLECEKFLNDCSPGICKKKTTGKNRFII